MCGMSHETWICGWQHGLIKQWDNDGICHGHNMINVQDKWCIIYRLISMILRTQYTFVI